MLRKNNAFTLVEIMIVVAIIVILSVMAVPMLMRARVNSNHSVARSALRTIETALESYAADNQIYPSDTNDLWSAQPRYLTVDYFDGGAHSGYTFSAVLGDYAYTITASPFSVSTGTKTFTLASGSAIVETE